MTIRRASLADLDLLMGLARREHGLSRFAGIPFDEHHAEQSFRKFIDDMASAVFVSERGFIGGMVQPMVFSRLWNAYELAWFAQDGSGMALLEAFTKWARSMRAVSLVVHCYSGIVPVEKFNKVMGRRGFENLGSSYSKSLGAI